MPASPIRKLAPYAEAATKRGIKIFHLNIGQPDIESPPLFWEAIRHYDHKVLEYSHSAGMPELRERVALHYKNIGIDVNSSQITVCTAGSEALSFSLLTSLNPGEEVLIPEPMYANYLGFSCGADIQVVPLTTRIENDFALPGIEEFEKALTPKTRAILINNPGNPTGTIYSSSQLHDLRDLALKHDLFVIADEVYREFNYTDHPVLSVLNLKGLEKHAIMIDSVSKRFSLCGARIGFLVSRNELINDAALRFAQARLCPPTLEQIGSLAAFDTEQSYFDEVRAEYMKRKDALVSRLRAMPGVVVPKIDGAFYATVALPIDDSDKFCQWLLEDFSHEGQTLMMAPATGFYLNSELGRKQVRIAYVLAVPELNKALDCLELALKQYTS